MSWRLTVGAGVSVVRVGMPETSGVLGVLCRVRAASGTAFDFCSGEAQAGIVAAATVIASTVAEDRPPLIFRMVSQTFQPFS